MKFDVPQGWALVPLSEVATVQTGLAMGKVVNGDALELPYLRVANVQDGHLDLDVIKTVAVSHDDVARFSLQPGDVLFTEGGDFDKLGRGTVWRGEVPNCLHQNHVFAVRPSPAKLLPEFLAALASSAHGRRFFQLSSKQSTNLASINSTQLKEFPVPLPSLDLQRKIAEILRTWDEALEKLTALRAAKARRLGSLRARLLFGKLRLHRRRHNWAATRLDAVTHELTRRNGAKGLGRDCVMGVTKAEGVVPMREQTIAGDISRYKRLPPRAFAYNPMRINVGSIAMNEREEEVLVSPDYVVFACNADGLDPDYLDHLRKTSWWAHYINSGGSGSVRQRTYYDDLAALKLPLPELDEQRAIAAVLNTARADMAATEREIEAVTQQKRGLMQKLLTGEWRVNSEKVLA